MNHHARLLDLELHDEFPAALEAVSIPVPIDAIEQHRDGKHVTEATLTLRQTHVGPTKEIVSVTTRDGWTYRFQRFDGERNLTLWRRDKPDGSPVGRRAAVPINVGRVVEAIEDEEIDAEITDQTAAAQAIDDAPSPPSAALEAEAQPVATDGGQDDLWTCGGCKATWTAERVEENPDEFGTHSCPSCPTEDDLVTDGGQIVPNLTGTITVCHTRNENIDTYGGRKRRGGDLAHLNNTEPPAPGWLGNPYPMEGDQDAAERRRVVAAYVRDFLDRIAADDSFTAAVEGLRGQRVACWCHGPSTTVTPENFCHLDVVRCYLDGDLSPVYAYLKGEAFELPTTDT